jgi:hypothetical protein
MTNTKEVGMMSDRSRSSTWAVAARSDEPVHDALVAARMSALSAGDSPGRLAMAGGGVVGDPAAVDARRGLDAGVVRVDDRGRARRSVARSLRLHVGRALIAAGGFVEGPCDCPDGTAGAGVGAS